MSSFSSWRIGDPAYDGSAGMQSHLINQIHPSKGLKLVHTPLVIIEGHQVKMMGQTGHHDFLPRLIYRKTTPDFIEKDVWFFKKDTSFHRFSQQIKSKTTCDFSKITRGFGHEDV